MSGRLAGKKVVITGAATGIGRAAVVMFVKEGAQVVIGDINEQGARETVELAGRGASFVRCDVTSESDIRALVGEAAKIMDGVDTLVNNAGMLPHKVVTDFDTALWDQTFAVNARSNFLTVKYALPPIRKAGGGAIINMSSIAGLRGGPGASAYAASKAAVNGLTVALALELAPDKIRVNSICPGWIDTPFNNPAIAFMGGPDVQARFIKSHTPLQRQGTPEEVAALMLYLAADESAFVTAQAISINGGAYN
jgi:dihydroanticapsin dehydrogenase